MNPIHRHIGGLETKQWLSVNLSDIHRHIGGLESIGNTH